ncbi:hypothetical protein ABL78_6464 [Leptomonas seymouri]|uniref:Uncharacterized protein n=1 Tax=Leptomonas seymouri TaxID=5684 RepID=A0A0N0P3S6_LEPSE|nr:hypothetical protein ABL78_6464 [Leptomonas seymouri]|eukprot:KPI84476.1 hypothetical protein ABL78_6464 [Leptomonas seymouri]
MAETVAAVPRPLSTATNRVSGCTQPPNRGCIDAFMLKYSGHLPHPVFDDGDRPTTRAYCFPTNSPRLMAPYLYSGADYALVLAACFPSRCIDLSLLNWSSSPLASQRQGNLRVFCESARALALPDAPLSALHPELLQSNPACVVAHLKVQHWLYSLSLRFTPHSSHDAATLRAVHRHLQLGEPYLKRQRAELSQQHDACLSVRDCAPISAEDLQQCCGPALAPTPDFLDLPDVSAQSRLSSSNARGGDRESEATVVAGDGSGNISGGSDGGEDASRTARRKPWLNYSKPWLLPSLRAAEAKKAASVAAAAKQEQAERERNPRYTAFAGQSKDLQQQYIVSRAAAVERRMQLLTVKAFIMQEVTEGRALDFKEIVDRLRGPH